MVLEAPLARGVGAEALHTAGKDEGAAGKLGRNDVLQGHCVIKMRGV